MKRLLFVFVCMVSVALFLSCNSDKKETTGTKDKTEKIEAVVSSSGIAGTYTTKENDMPMQFILKEDGSGQENYHGDMRPFSWVKKDGKIFFKYDGQPTEFELPIDTEKGEIHYGSLVYKKE